MTRRTMPAAAVAAVALCAGVAMAAWTTAGTGTGFAKGATAQPPATASAAQTAGSTHNSLTVTWTAPASGPAPTSYRVDRTSPAGQAATGVCSGLVLSCVDGGRTPSTSYVYNVFALVGTHWVSTARATAAVSTAAAPSSGTTYYLRNGTYPTPSDGDSVLITPRMPLSKTASTQNPVSNYDTDKNSFPGRQINKGGSGAGEIDPTEIAKWQYDVPSKTLFNGTATLEFWAAHKEADTTKGAGFTVFVRQETNDNSQTYALCGTGTATIAMTTLGGGTNWTKLTASIPVNCTLGENDNKDQLEVLILVTSASDDDVKIAYGSAGQPASLLMPGTEGVS